MKSICVCVCCIFYRTGYEWNRYRLDGKPHSLPTTFSLFLFLISLSLSFLSFRFEIGSKTRYSNIPLWSLPEQCTRNYSRNTILISRVLTLLIIWRAHIPLLSKKKKKNSNRRYYFQDLFVGEEEEDLQVYHPQGVNSDCEASSLISLLRYYLQIVQKKTLFLLFALKSCCWKQQWWRTSSR